MPVFAISDLHLGDCGPRDNFAYGERVRDFTAFLDMVEDNHGRLVICGDLFELWQSNMSKVLTARPALLARLANMDAVYVLGNHDADLNYFMEDGWLKPAFFRTMCGAHYERVGGRTFYFLHGHQVDPYCSGDTPGIGRITAIYSGLAEDRNGGPMLDKYRTVEDRVVGPLEKLASLWGRLRGKPERFTAINRALLEARPEGTTIVCGHTHKPGRVGDRLYNCGTWAERVNSFVMICDHGDVGVYDWVDRRAVHNWTELPA